MTRAKRASYRDAVTWCALNDTPYDASVDSIAGYISVLLVAQLFGKPAYEVARDVHRLRRTLGLIALCKECGKLIDHDNLGWYHIDFQRYFRTGSTHPARPAEETP